MTCTARFSSLLGLFVLFALCACGRSPMLPPAQDQQPCDSELDCPATFHCALGFCAPHNTTSTGGETSENPAECARLEERTCADLGTVSICEDGVLREELCAAAEQCVGGRCVDRCAEGQVWCAGEDVAECFRGEPSIIDRCGPQERCREGRCVQNDPECEEGARECISSDRIRECEGGVWVDNQFCADGAQCQDGECLFIAEDLPDIQPEIFAPTRTIEAGVDVFSWRAVVSNLEFAFAEPFSCTAYLRPEERPQNPATDLILDAFFVDGGLSGGEVTSPEIQAGPFSEGTWRAYIVCDAENIVAETNERNNVAESPNVLVVREELRTGPHDLAVESLSVSPNPISPEDTLRVRYTLSNLGEFANEGDVQCALFLDEERIVIAPDTWFASRREQGVQLAPGEARLFTWDVPLERRVFPGEWRVALECIDYDFQDQLSSNQSYFLEEPLRVVNDPTEIIDLSIEQVDPFPWVHEIGDTWETSFRVCNASDTDARDVELVVELFTNNAPNPQPAALNFGPFVVPEIEANTCIFFNTPTLDPLTCPEPFSTYTVGGRITGSTPPEAPAELDNNAIYGSLPISIRGCIFSDNDTPSICEDTLGGRSVNLNRLDLIPSLPDTRERVAICEEELNNSPCVHIPASPDSVVRFDIEDLCGGEEVAYELYALSASSSEGYVIQGGRRLEGRFRAAQGTCSTRETIRLPLLQDPTEDSFMMCFFLPQGIYADFTWEITLDDVSSEAQTDLAVVGFDGDLYDGFDASLPVDTDLAIEVLVANYGQAISEDLLVTLYLAEDIIHNSEDPVPNALRTYVGPLAEIGSIQLPLSWGDGRGGRISVPARIPSSLQNLVNPHIIAILGSSATEYIDSDPNPYEQRFTDNDWNARPITLIEVGDPCTEENPPNNTIAQATPLDVETVRSDALCPRGDVDVFAVNVPEDAESLLIIVSPERVVEGENFSLSVFGPNQEFLRQSFSPSIELNLPVATPGTHYLRLATSSARESVPFSIQVQTP